METTERLLLAGSDPPGPAAFGQKRTPGWWQAGFVRHDPYLKELSNFVFVVHLAVNNTGSSTHHLHIACLRTATIAKIILVRDCASPHIGDDLHVAVRMPREPRVWRAGVIVPDSQTPPVHTFGIVMFGE